MSELNSASRRCLTGDRELRRIITIEALRKSFDHGRIPVLRDTSLRIFQGELVALWGSSGSGKTTLLHLIGGLDTPDAGRITVDGLNPASENDRLELRRTRVGFVFQLHNLIPNLTMKENCLVTAIGARGDQATFRRRFGELASLLKIDHRQDRRIQELSGGERQRVAICRALMHRPRILLADEPTGSLDERTGENVFRLLVDVARQEGVTVVMATHERRFAEQCDRIIHTVDGRVSEAV